MVSVPAELAEGVAGSSWRTRIRAWWDGEQPSPSAAAPRVEPAVAAKKPARSPADDGAPTVASWPATRIGLIQDLFGPGMATPGGQAAIDAILAPLALGASSSFAELGSGLGGIARAIAATGANIAAFEANVALASAANTLSQEANPTRPVDIQNAQYDRIKLPPATLDGIVAKEALLTWRDKAKLLGHLRKMLKPGGKMVISDWFRNCEPSNPTLQVWAVHEPVDPHFMSVAEIRAEFDDLSLEIDRSEDISADYQHWVTHAFASHAGHLQADGASPAAQAWAISEAEFWARRISLLKTGDLVMQRFVVVAAEKGR